tara:strand:- start:590 stop:1384 length:795 start_codon:yes stop_codon:yes gene_type:complete
MIIDMNKLILSRNILFVVLGIKLVVLTYYCFVFFSSINITEDFNLYLDIIIWRVVIPYLITFAGLFLTYLRFQKKYLKANWGLLVFASYIFIAFASETYQMLFYSSFYWQYIPFTLILDIAIFYAIYLILPEMMPSIFSQMKNSKNVQIYQPSEELSEKEFLPTLILCFFVGFLGIHRFFVGKLGTGILMIVTFGGLGIWILVDFIMICVGSFRDIDGRIIKYQRSVVIKSEASVADELKKFAELKDKGVISEEEFNKKKEELL